jgi:hypothetical protein
MSVHAEDEPLILLKRTFDHPLTVHVGWMHWTVTVNTAYEHAALR